MFQYFRSGRPGQDGFTLIELISTLVIISVLAAIWIPRYIDADSSARMRGLDVGVSELNGRETLTWAVVKMSNTGYRPVEGDIDVWERLKADPGLSPGADYSWTAPPTRTGGGELIFKKTTKSTVDRNESTIETPGKWQKL